MTADVIDNDQVRKGGDSLSQLPGGNSRHDKTITSGGQMKYKVSVVKRITLLLMTMALAVALVACSGAAGTQGPPGPPGPPGQDAPTPEPTDPPAPTDPPEPAGPPNAAPEAMMIPNVYLALAGTGKMDKTTVDLNKYITDADSVLRFSATSSAPTVATVKESNGMLTISAKGAGPATIAVMAHDGRNDPVPAEIMVHVVKTNAAPTTNGLSGSDKTKLEAPLYIADGTAPFVVTIISDPGPASDSFEDAIVDKYDVVIGDKDKTNDDHVTVVMKKGAGNKHHVNVTPKPGTNGKSVDVMIYPKDMFGAPASEPWKFKAMVNMIPKVLTDSFSIELTRAAAAIDYDGTSPDNAAVITLSEYFQAGSLQVNVDPANVDNDLTVNSDTEIDMNGDTRCAVAYDPKSLAIVMPLNDSSSAVSSRTEYATTHYATGNQAVEAILIDSRVTSYGADGTYAGTDTVSVKNTDTVAKGEGTVTVTITCTDKDASAKVTGKVVVRT